MHKYAICIQILENYIQDIQDVQNIHLTQKILLEEFKRLHAQSGILNN